MQSIQSHSRTDLPSYLTTASVCLVTVLFNVQQVALYDKWWKETWRTTVFATHCKTRQRHTVDTMRASVYESYKFLTAYWNPTLTRVMQWVNMSIQCKSPMQGQQILIMMSCLEQASQHLQWFTGLRSTWSDYIHNIRLRGRESCAPSTSPPHTGSH